MEFSSRKSDFDMPQPSKGMTRALVPEFSPRTQNDHELLEDLQHHSLARVSLAEYALLAALLVILILGVIATTTTQIGSDILALL